MSGYDLSGVVPDLPCDGGDCPDCPDCPDKVMALTTNINNGQVGVPFSQECFATGGFPPYLWNQYGIVWPDGISQDLTTGVISGTPTTPVLEQPIVLHVQDLVGGTGWCNASMTIEA